MYFQLNSQRWDDIVHINHNRVEYILCPVIGKELVELVAVAKNPISKSRAKMPAQREGVHDTHVCRWMHPVGEILVGQRGGGGRDDEEEDAEKEYSLYKQ